MMLALLALLALTWYPSADWGERPDPVASPLARRGGTIRLNGAQPPKSFNAYVDNNNYSAMVFDLMYGKLLAMSSVTGELEPALARRWAVSDDGREFTFVLDDRATWSDGQPVTADDVKWTFDAVMDPKNATGPWKSMLNFFESPEIVDVRTVRFRKKGVSPRDWRDILNCSTFWIMPKHAFAGQDFNKLNLVGAVVGGAYGIARAEPQVETELRRHGRWWCQDLPQCRGTMNFDRILVRYFAENENAFEALKKRKVDVYPVYTARIYEKETGSAAFRHNWLLKHRVRNRAPIGFQGFAMNMRHPPFDDLRVRRAMAALVDRETMNRTMMNNAYFLLRSYFTDIYDEANPCGNELHAFDPAKAARLLDEAGWKKDPSDGLLKKDGRPFAFSFLSRSATEDKFLALFDQALRSLGIKMTIVRKDFASWMRDMDEFAFDMTWAAWGAGTVKYPELSWSGAEADRKGSNNITGFKSAEVDRLIAEEKGMDDASARTAAYRKIDALVAAEVPYVLLWQTDSTRLLYWNKFGTPAGVLSPAEREESVLPYWWYDEDRAEELERAISNEGFLPAVPETVVPPAPPPTSGTLLEAESFADLGGWSVDQQFMDQMGSPYVLAHGIGKPVADAVTTVDLPQGKCRLWVRTRDWCRPMAELGPGRFRVMINGEDLGEFGTGGSGEWEWTKGPELTISRTPSEVRLVDGSGFDGRVDALFFGVGNARPPENWAVRKRLLGLGRPTDESADFVVVGGGLAGVCAAVSAAREGLSVALVQDRLVFGGNASSEVRVHVLGQIGLGPFPHNGDVLKEVLKFADRTQGPAYGDNWKLDDKGLEAYLVRQKGLRLFPGTRAMSVEKNAAGQIVALVGRNVRSGRETRFSAKLFLDATGDGAIAVAAGADYRDRPECRSETGERLAPDGLRQGGDYGSSLYWFTRETATEQTFPSCPWALAVDRAEDALVGGEVNYLPSGGWNWETGFWEDNIKDGERIRDRLLRAVYGVWDFTKNKRADRARFAKAEIYWLGQVLGKRAARRVLGDYILTEQDLEEQREHPDGVVTTDWYIDLHFPHPVVERRFGRDTFRSTAYDAQRPADCVDTNRFVGGQVTIKPYAIPYRCLYSRNVPNLFLAGKDISATHVAMGSHRVMNTGGAMGAVVGRAAALCVRENLLPRQLSTGGGLDRLKALLALPIPAER